MQAVVEVEGPAKTGERWLMVDLTSADDVDNPGERCGFKARSLNCTRQPGSEAHNR